MEKRVTPSHAVRSMPCPAPFSARNPPCGGFFRPFCRPQPRNPPFSPRRPAAFPEKPRRKSPSPRRSRPVFPVSARHCAPVAARNAPAVRRFPENPPAFAPDSPVYSAVCPHLARDPARFVPEAVPCTAAARPGCAPPPRVPSPLGLPPRPAPPLRRGEACTPLGGPQSLGAILRRPPPSRLRNFAKFKAFFPAWHAAG